MARELQFQNQPALISYAKLFYPYTFNLISWWSQAVNFRLTREGTADVPLEAVWSAPQKMFAGTDSMFNGQPPTPIVSIFLIDVEHRPEVDLPREIKGIRKVGGKTYQVSKPKPFFLMYQCTLWTEHNADMDELITQLHHHSNQNMIWLQFKQDDPTIEPKHRELIGNYMPMWIDSIQDNTDFEVGDTASRIVRKDITLKVEAYLPYPVEEVQTIQTITNGLYVEGILTKQDFIDFASQRPHDQPPETLTYIENNDGNYDYTHYVGDFNF